MTFEETSTLPTMLGSGTNEGSNSSKDDDNDNSDKNNGNNDINDFNNNQSNDNNSRSKEVIGWNTCLSMQGIPEARAYGVIESGVGTITISNIFLSISLIYLAEREAGCDNIFDHDEEVEICSNTIYAFKPLSLITNITVISGLISAFFLPFIGAMIDFTSHRRKVGAAAAVTLIILQAIQIGTLSGTWFYMATIIQPIAILLFQIHTMVRHAYLPEIAIQLSEPDMSSVCGTITVIATSSQTLFAIIIILIATMLGLNHVAISQLSQGISVLWMFATFYYGWYKLPNIPKLHEVEITTTAIAIATANTSRSSNDTNRTPSIFISTFVQNWKTFKGLTYHYHGTLRWFFLATMFGDAAASTYVVITTTFMVHHLRMSSDEINVVFLFTLAGSIIGSVVAGSITRRTNPCTSWKLCTMMITLSIICISLSMTSPEQAQWMYLFGSILGMLLGWFYVAMIAFFSLSVPQGQQTELAGFFFYSRMVLSWLPPLLFTLFNDVLNVSMQYGLLTLSIFFFLSFICISLHEPWEKVITSQSLSRSKNVDTLSDEYRYVLHDSIQSALLIRPPSTRDYALPSV